MHRRDEIKALTGIRFFAVALVVVNHFSDNASVLFPWMEHWVGFTQHTGVDLFFILSGFLLTVTYAEQFRRVDLTSYLRFLGTRLARIYPLHLLCLAVLGAAVVYAQNRGIPLNHPENYQIGDLWRNLLLIQAWGGDLRGSWNYPSWTISAQWFAYLLFPLTVRPIRAVGATPLLAVVYAGTAAAVLLLGLLVVPFTASAMLRVTTEFVMGCFLAQFFLMGVATRLPWAAIAGIVLVMIVGLMTVVPPDGNRMLLVPLLGMLVLALAHAKSAPASWLGSRPIVFLGRVSFALFLLHGVVDLVGAKLVPMEDFVGAPLAVQVAIVAAYYVALLVAAVAGYHVVEQPASRRVRTWFRNSPPRLSHTLEPAR